MSAPDPIVCASIYCNARLDQVIHRAVAPAWERLREDREAGWMLWWVRYSLNGDHLKLRLHGPGMMRDHACRVVTNEVQAYFATLPLVDPGEARISRARIPAIDPEDESGHAYPDRTLLWTTYRRSPVSLGPQQLLGDDGYAARISTCLGYGAEVVLASTSLADNGRIPAPMRQRTLLRLLVAAIGASGIDAAHRAEYLAYHRDWLLRFAVNDGKREAEVVGMFDQRVDGMQAGVDRLRHVATARWGAPGGAVSSAGIEGAWSEAVAELCAHCAAMRGRIPEPLDPFGADPVFPPLFKALHGVANQVGLDMLNEAFVHHLMLRVVAAIGPCPSGHGILRGSLSDAA
jgi:hypothetical protein